MKKEPPSDAPQKALETHEAPNTTVVPTVRSAPVSEALEREQRVARALCRNAGVDPDATSPGTWDGGSYGVPAWLSWIDDARAAIEAY